jgi:hypothetical protein
MVVWVILAVVAEAAAAADLPEANVLPGPCAPVINPCPT